MQPLWKTVGSSSELTQSYHGTQLIPLPGMYPKEVKTGTQTNTRTHMFTAALFKIDKRQEQPKCLLMEEWVSKL